MPYHPSTPYQTLQSEHVFHERPDGADVFLDSRSFNVGGWVYVSNSETKDGSVSAMTFDAAGNVIHYHRILTGSMWYDRLVSSLSWGASVTRGEHAFLYVSVRDSSLVLTLPCFSSF